MHAYQQLAKALQYPHPDQLESLQAGAGEIQDPAVQRLFQAFLEKVSELSRGEWEELYTSTLDLNPRAAPYLGFQIWGENYKRGEFMSLLNKELRSQGIERGGELPDHLVPVLRYLSVSQSPLPELEDIFPRALKKMQKELESSDPDNPYLHLLQAIHKLAPSHQADENIKQQRN